MSTTNHASPEAGASMAPPREHLFRADFTPDIELRETPDGRPVMAGHFTRFNEWTEINSVWEGRFMERIDPSALTKTINENRAGIKVLFQHGRDVLGNQVLGPIQELRVEEAGPYYEVPLFDGVPDLIVNGLRAGAYGASFRFSVLREEFNNKPKKSKANPEGIPERTIMEAKVSEFGPVTFPAYANATAGLRSLTDDFVLARFIDEPDRLLELVEAFKERRAEQNNEEESEPSAATTPPTPRKPERSVATTPRSKVNIYTGQKEQPAWLL